MKAKQVNPALPFNELQQLFFLISSRQFYTSEKYKIA
jgi:hypothetical protein